MRALVLIHEPPPVFRAETFTDHDLSMAANEIILAMDGKMLRADALMCARAAFESIGMEKKHA